MLIDTHCHLDDKKLQDKYADIINNFEKRPFKHLINYQN